MSQAELGRLTGIDRSDVATSLDGLGRDRFIARAPDAADRRRNVVSITARGRDELSRLDAVLADVQTRFLAPLDKSERATLLALIGRLADEDPVGW